VVRLVDSKAVVALMTFEVSRDIRDVRIVPVVEGNNTVLHTAIA
jgi:hypothetical protein